MRYTIQKLQSLPWHIYSRLDNVSFNPYISELICTFWTAFVLFNTSLKNTRLSDFVKPDVLFLTTLVLSWIDPLYTNFYSVPSVCHRGMEVLLKRGIIRTIGVITIIWSVSYLNTRRENTTVARKVTGIKVNVSSKSTWSSINKAKYLSAFSGFSLFSTDDNTKT